MSDHHENLYFFLCLRKEELANILLLVVVDMHSLWNQIVNIIDT